MTFTTLEQIKTSLSDGKVLTTIFRGAGPSSAATPAWQSGWYTQTVPSVGGDPAAGSATPGAGGTVYTNAVGGINFPNTADEKRLINFFFRHEAGTNTGVKLVDRLVGVGSIAVNSTGNKDVGSVALTRYTTGEAIECYVEIQTAGITTAPVVSLASYTNQDGVTGRAGATLTFNSATASKGTLQGPMPLQLGDTGIRSVETLNVATAGGGSGVVNIILVKTLVWSGVVGYAVFIPGVERLSPLPYVDFSRIYDGATLMWMRKGASSSTNMEGYVKVVLG